MADFDEAEQLKYKIIQILPWSKRKKWEWLETKLKYMKWSMKELVALEKSVRAALKSEYEEDKRKEEEKAKSRSPYLS